MNDRMKTKRDPFFNWIKEAGTESPSQDFYLSVMSKLEEKKSIITYDPVISKKQWIVIGSVFAFIILITFTQNSLENTWSDWISQLPEIKKTSSIFFFSYTDFTSFCKDEYCATIHCCVFHFKLCGNFDKK